MPSRRSRRTFLGFLLIASILLVYLVSARRLRLWPFMPAIETVALSASAPAITVDPLPGDILAVDEFLEPNEQKTICVRLNAEEILEPGDSFSTEELLSRFSLTVDGKSITKEPWILIADTFGYDGPIDPETGQPEYRVPPGTPPEFCYAVVLEPGVHEAVFRARKTSGAEKHFTWSFTLTDQIFVVAKGLPPFLFFTHPAPGSILTVEEYEAYNHLLSAGEPSVCLMISPYYLMEPGDKLAPDEFVARLSLQIDGQLAEMSYLDSPENSGFYDAAPDPQTGEPPFQVSLGLPQTICYGANLSPGLHEATLTYRKSSGDEARYDWPFILADPTKLEFMPANWKVRHDPPDIPGPHFFSFLYPYEYDTPIAEYLAYAPSHVPGATEPSICLMIDPFYILEPGDDLSTEEVLSRLRLKIYYEDIEIDKPSSYIMTDSQTQDGPLDLATGEPLFKLPPGSPYFICFAADLGPGRYLASFVGQKTSGDELPFAWQFALVEE